MSKKITNAWWIEIFASARAVPIEGQERYQIVGQFDGDNDFVISAEFFDEDVANMLTRSLRETYGPKPERPASDIDLRAFLDVCFGWYGEDDSAVPISRQVISFFNGRHGLKIPNAGTVTTPYKNQVTGETVPSKIYPDWVPAARGLADDFESLAAQIREILENSDA